MKTAKTTATTTASAMPWNRAQITSVALSSSAGDYAAFDAIGLSEIENARVLDVGCFDGFNTRLKFGAYANIAEVVGIEPNTHAFKLACEEDLSTTTRFTWENVDILNYKGDKESFDLVYFGHVFQHLACKEEVLSKVHALLKPGAWVVIKTVDDSTKISYPDPDKLMSKVFDNYEGFMKTQRAHTVATDRNNGSKCYSLLTRAGFSPAYTDIRHTNTASMTPEEREAFFERMVYFRRVIPDSLENSAEKQKRTNELLNAWHELFMQEDYFFDSATFIARGMKPKSDTSAQANKDSASFCVSTAQQRGKWSLAPLNESEIGELMLIETRVFPNPWTPLAYVSELRYNPDAHYVAARNAQGHLVGYVGWWNMPDRSVITHIATDTSCRRQGLGRILVDFACKQASAAAKPVMDLTVRKSNTGAIAFYDSLGFVQTGLVSKYYENPLDDGILMRRSLRAQANVQEEGK